MATALMTIESIFGCQLDQCEGGVTFTCTGEYFEVIPFITFWDMFGPRRAKKEEK
jgi:hypothetical protein